MICVCAVHISVCDLCVYVCHATMCVLGVCMCECACMHATMFVLFVFVICAFVSVDVCML